MKAASLVVLLSLLASSLSWADGCYIPRAEKRSLKLTYNRDITEPTQKAVIVHFDGKERLILEVGYKGRVSEFAWLIPTPSQPKVKKFDPPIFHELHVATAPRTVYWIDSKKEIINPYSRARGGSADKKPDVKVIEQKQIGAYDVAVLKAGNAEDLIKWLRANKYRVSTKLTRVVEDYIKRGWIFTAARVNVDLDREDAAKLREGRLQSIQLDFASPQPIYPLKISSLNKGLTKLLIYVVDEVRVDSPKLKTTCAFNAHSGIYWSDIREAACLAFDKDIYPESPFFITKLTGNISSKQMTEDLIFKPAKSNEPLPMPTVEAPFLDNIGAIVLAVIALLVIPPLNAVPGLFFLALALSAKRKQLRRVFYTLAAFCFFGAFVIILILLPLGEYSNGAVGAGTIALVVGIPILILARRRKARRLPKS